MSSRNVYSPATSRTRSASRKSRPSDGDGEVDIPRHAHPYLDSIRKGSPVIPLIICYILGFGLMIAGFAAVAMKGAADQEEAAGSLLMVLGLACLPLLIGLVFAVKMIYRLSGVMQLDQQAPSTSPTASTVLCLVPLVSIVGQILLLLKVKQHYPRIVDSYGLEDAPQVGGGLLTTVLVCSILSMIPFVNFLALPVLFISGLILFFKFHRVLNYFAVRI